MNRFVTLDSIKEGDRHRVGGKSFSLARLGGNGFRIPEAVCVTTAAYDDYVTITGLQERILFELNRKEFKDMRWEELWDAALRIRNMFLKHPMPEELDVELREALGRHFEGKAAVVRSSAPGEDSAKASFAGLHESFVNVRGVDSILEHVRLVWASLWSDAALLYRQELGLDVETSTMAVLVQGMVTGQCSGVAFTVSPNDERQGVIEAVYGLNQGLVDGTVEPDRWILDRVTKKIISHTAAVRDQYIVPGPRDLLRMSLPDDKSSSPPLSNKQVNTVFDVALQIETLFGGAQDVEWTFHENELYVLQARPITTLAEGVGEDKRGWYLSLRRSFENLKVLRSTIEGQLIPEMMQQATALARENLTGFSDGELAGEIRRRSSIYQKWVDVYRTDFIPFAHGARLFGQVYNDTVRPEDPFEFVDLLRSTKMASMMRNEMLIEMASMVKGSPRLGEKLKERDFAGISGDFMRKLEDFNDKFGNLYSYGTPTSSDPHWMDIITAVILEMVDHPFPQNRLESKDIQELERGFLSHFDDDRKPLASELVELARASYQLRDDDNIYLGRIEGQMRAAIQEGKRRLEGRGLTDLASVDGVEVAHALENSGYIPERTPASQPEISFNGELRARQLKGQPAGPGIAKGKARVIISPSDLKDFKHGEVLVCDAVDPNMTFVVPLARGVVERRGGMLIHGAIIAREYGLPCVTGIADATSFIHTGDPLTVDGYLGIVTIG